MSTNYRVTTPSDIFNRETKTKHNNDESSLLDQVGSVLKGSLQFIWNYVKMMDVVKKGTVANSADTQSKNSQGKQNILGMKNIINNNKSLAKGQSLNNNNELIRGEQEKQQHCISKRQKLKQKKQRKRISFDQFIQKEERKINDSFIKKNIEKKKLLNKSLMMMEKGQPHADNDQGRLLLDDDSSIQQKVISKQQLHHYHQSKQKQPIPATNPTNNHHAHNFIDSLILNISDIDSECNFNILNSSQLNQSSSKNQNYRGQLLRDNLEGIIQNNVGGELVPKLQLKEYPFLGHDLARMSCRATQKNKNQERKTSKTTKNVNSSKTKGKQQQPVVINIDNNNDTEQKDYIDVDALYYPPLEHNPKKRITAPFMKSNQTQLRKKIKHNQHMYSSQSTKNSAKLLEKQEKFDRLVASRYEKMIEAFNGQKQDDQEHTLTLKQQYEKFLLQNFSASIALKQKLQKQGSTVKNKTQSQQKQKQKFSQHLKEVDLSPQIERKKLYNFTKQCESKISVREQLRRSVIQDKQKQLQQELKRKQQQQIRKRKEEEEMIKRKVQQMRKKEQELRKIKQKEQEQIKIVADQLKKQQNEVLVEGQKQNQFQKKDLPQITQQKQITEQDNIPAVKVKEVVPVSNVEQSKQGQQKQPVAKPLFSLFEAPKISSSLFSLAEKKPSQENITQQKKVLLQLQQSSPKSSEETTKITNLIEGKSNEEIKKKEIEQGKTTVEEITKTPEVEGLKKTEPAKINPFLAPVKTPAISLLKQIINTKKDDNSLFKSTITSTPLTSNSPQHQPPTQNANVFLSPAHNTSHYSNLDSSMCQQSESNIITPGNSQILPNNILPANNLNGSFLNASFSSQANSVFPGNSASLFNGTTTSGMFGQTSGMFGNTNSQAMTGGLFSNQTPGLFMQSTGQSTQAAKYEAVHKIPSFMQNQTSSLPTISPQTAANLFSQKSPSKNEPQSLFAPTPLPSKPSQRRRDKKKQQRIR